PPTCPELAPAGETTLLAGTGPRATDTQHDTPERGEEEEEQRRFRAGGHGGPVSARSQGERPGLGQGHTAADGRPRDSNLGRALPGVGREDVPGPAIEDEGGNPDEIEITSEGNKKASKRSSKGRKPEEEGVEDNGLEENSGDGQEDVETSLENLQDIDMMDISVLDEAEIDNGSVADCVEDDDADNLQESLSDSRELVEGEMKELTEQLQEHAVEDKETINNLDTSSSDFTILQEIEEPSLEPENEKILDILGETCKSEPGKEEGSELEQPFAQDTSSVGPDRKLAEEEDLFDSAHPEEGDLDLASESTHAQAGEADSLLAVVKREPVEQPGDGGRTDCEPVGPEPAVEQSSAASENAEASSEEVAEAPTEAPSPEARDSKEDGKKFAFEACNEVPPAPKESSASEGADQKMRFVFSQF
ncbi:scaffold attachment factor B1-like, partial [Carlito syrichta]|uniref:Scaffold attachment factor B1-like n=1 Tax=Carlito syrichta TaxID=1868482 RepID=A0A3Q0DSK8_CARSF